MGGRHDMGLPAWDFTQGNTDASLALQGCGHRVLPSPPPPQPVGTPKPWVHAVGANPPHRPLLPGVPTGSILTQERSELSLIPMARPACRPRSWVWNSRRGYGDEGRMKAGIPFASSPGKSGAGAAALQQRASSRDAGVPGGERRDPFCHPHPLLRAETRAWGPVATSFPPRPTGPSAPEESVGLLDAPQPPEHPLPLPHARGELGKEDEARKPSQAWVPPAHRHPLPSVLRPVQLRAPRQRVGQGEEQADAKREGCRETWRGGQML